MTNELWCSFVSAECSLPFMLVHLVNIVPRMTSQFVWQFTLCCLPTQSENFRKRLQLKLPSTHSLHKVMKTAIDRVTIQRRGDFTKIPENWSLVLMVSHFISYQIQSAFCCICLHSIQSTLASQQTDGPPTTKLRFSFSPDSLCFLVHCLVTLSKTHSMSNRAQFVIGS